MTTKQDRIEELFRESSADITDRLTTRQLTTITHGVSAIEASDGTKFDTFLDRQIDHFRDLINDNRPKTALGLLERLWQEIPQDVDGHLRVRVQANRAFAPSAVRHARAAKCNVA